MPEPRAQRTLVKSPPELWAEVSDVSTLARHLGEFGDIRITRLEAETTVVWEGDRARGTVNLEPSGWGTKVTITAEAIAAEAEEAAAEEAEAVVAEPEPEAVAPEPEPEPEAVAEPESVAATTEPEPEAAQPPRRRGIWARLFGRRAQPEPVVEEEPAADEAPIAVAEPIAEAEIEPEVVPTVAAPEPPEAIEEPAIEGEITAAALDAERMEAVLVSVLDDLGSAHHRPFSRG
jgi:hypothetical protein